MVHIFTWSLVLVKGSQPAISASNMASLLLMKADQNTGPWLKIKMLSYQYRKSHCGDKAYMLLESFDIFGGNVLGHRDISCKVLLHWQITSGSLIIFCMPFRLSTNKPYTATTAKLKTLRPLACDNIGNHTMISFGQEISASNMSVCMNNTVNLNIISITACPQFRDDSYSKTCINLPMNFVVLQDRWSFRTGRKAMFL